MAKKIKMAALAKAAEDSKNRVYKGTESNSQYRELDFWDMRRDRPCLPLEYLYGTRGLMTGKIIKYEAKEGDGKSSSIFMNYGMLQRTGGAYIVHLESEEAPPPPDFMYHLGCNPEELLIEHPTDVKQCFKRIEDWITKIRTDIDPDMDHPIILSVDSVSALAGNDPNAKPKKGANESSGDKSLSLHSREVSRWLRDNMARLTANEVVLMFSGQLKANIKISSFGGGGGRKTKENVTIAEAPMAYHATWIIELYHTRLWVDGVGDMGETITMRCIKNKQEEPRRQVKVKLIRKKFCEEGQVGWDWDDANKDLLFGNAATKKMCWPNDEATSGGGWYRHKDILDNKNLRWDDFIVEFYKNEKVLMEVRNNLSVRGYNLPFETQYMLKKGAPKDAKDS
jgi:RecA/RadA recombinase